VTDREFVELEGVNFKVVWKKFDAHSSFFVPCLNLKEGKRVLRRVCKERKYKVRVQTDIDEDVQGVRVWRLEDEK